jgi:hypothetical protein
MLWRDLRDVIAEMGCQFRSELAGVGGSQEIAAVAVSIRGHELMIESETYFGLSISGDEDTVEEIAARVAARRNR